MHVASLMVASWLSGLAQLPYSSPELGFTMTVPAGFAREAEDPQSPVQNFACFVSTDRERPWIRLCAERQGGGLPRGARHLRFAWNGKDLEGATFRSEWERTNESVDVVAVNVPLQKERIWLVAMTPSGQGAYAQAAVVSALSTLQGATGQASSDDRAERAGEQAGLIGGIIMAVGAGMWIMQRRMRKKESGK